MFYTVFGAPTNAVFSEHTSRHSSGDGNFPFRKNPKFVENQFLKELPQFFKIVDTPGTYSWKSLHSSCFRQ